MSRWAMGKAGDYYWTKILWIGYASRMRIGRLPNLQIAIIHEDLLALRSIVPPGRCLVLLTPEASALWVTSWPKASFVRHAWAGAWICSLFRNEDPSRHLSSELICDAVAATRAHFGKPPTLGIVTFIDAKQVRQKRDPGRCFRKAGFHPVGYTKGGLVALQFLPSEIPSAALPGGMSLDPFRNSVCPVCERSFLQPERGRKRVYCGDACQQAAYRARMRTIS